jgi:hypothetical protein
MQKRTGNRADALAYAGVGGKLRDPSARTNSGPCFCGPVTRSLSHFRGTLSRPGFEANQDVETWPIYALAQDEIAGLHHLAVGPGGPVTWQRK